MRSNDSEPVSQNRNRSLDERSRRCGASLGTRVRHDSNPLTRFRSNFIFYLIAARKDARTIRSSMPRLSTKMPSRKRSSASAPLPSSSFRGLGHRPQTGALREAGPDRLRRGAPPRRRATRHPLDARRTRAVDHGALLADGLYRVSAPAEAAAPLAHTGRPLSRVPAWIARHARGADDERDPALFLVNLRGRIDPDRRFFLHF